MKKSRRKDGRRAVAVTQIVLLVVGVALVVLGLLNGEVYEIFSKATVICMDCIGIG
jgi:hypothetical protein